MGRNIFSKVNSALKKLEKFKKNSSDKGDNKPPASRLAEMQKLIDLSPEKRAELIRVIREEKSVYTNVPLIEKGVVLYIKLLEVIDVIEKDLEDNGIEYKTITSAQNAKSRSKINDWFSNSPENKVIILSDCGGESLNLNQTNELVVYNIPDGVGKFNQLIGRIARMFGKFHEFYIHQIIVKNSIDEYKQHLLSSKHEVGLEILQQDSIPVKENSTYNLNILKKVRERLLWKKKK